MRKYINIMLAVVLAGILAGCSKDNPFDGELDQSTGGLLTSALDVSLYTEGGPRLLHKRDVRTAAPEIDKFRVEFVKEGETEPKAVYLYSEMPEIVTLPVGHYIARAHHGDNPEADWEAPYYKGEVEFDIYKDRITDDVEPIKCKFSNIRVSVDFADNLKAVMEDDCYVTVNVAKSGTLNFTLGDTDRSGYFAHAEGSETLTATFTGTVDGARTTETKTYQDVAPGKHYAITFRLHDAGEEDPGDIDKDDLVIVDASVEVDNMNESVDSSEGTLTDDMRPQEDFGDDDPGKTPENPDTPEVPAEGAPVITVDSPLDIDSQNLIDENSEITIHIKAENGIRDFTVRIDSNILTPDELGEVGLPAEMDLVNPGDDYADALGEDGFGFPIRDKVKGQTEVDLSITSFVPMLLGVAASSPLDYKYYNFILKVTDSKGNTTTATLKLYNR